MEGVAKEHAGAPGAAERGAEHGDQRGAITLFLCGDVMTGRGIDQVLPDPVPPRIHEAFMRSALGYVELAEKANGPIPRPVGFEYVWGDALAEIEARAPDWRIANVETSVTRSEDAAPKGINYRMSPGNIGCLTAAELDCCVLANNHVLDWGPGGLLDTLAALSGAGFALAGAGRDAREAQAPAVLGRPGLPRVLVFGFCEPDSGVPKSWAAGPGRPGVARLPDRSPATAALTAERIRAQSRPDDIVIASVHWGGNWGYEVPAEQRAFAHALIDGGAVDVVHGHSSHHPKGIERHGDKLVLYGCGDFVNDYEGISDYERYRSDLTVAYFPTLDAASGRLLGLSMAPFRMRRFRLERTGAGDTGWLRATLERASADFGTRLVLDGETALRLA